MRSIMSIAINLLTDSDDGASLFNNLEDNASRCDIICRMMDKWVLTVYEAHSGEKSKTDFLHLQLVT